MKRSVISASLAVLSLLGVLATTNAYAATSSTNTSSHPHQGFGHGFGPGFMSSLPTILKVSKTTLQADFKAGKTILQIAQKQGISEATLIAKMESAEKTQISKLVKSKRITAAQEKQILSRFNSNVKKMITSKMNARPFPRNGSAQPPRS